MRILRKKNVTMAMTTQNAINSLHAATKSERKNEKAKIGASDMHWQRNCERTHKEHTNQFTKLSYRVAAISTLIILQDRLNGKRAALPPQFRSR